MKPRTKLQYDVMHNSNYMVDRRNALLPWAKKECLEHIGYATKNKVSCMDCGESFSPALVSRKRATCPHCDTKLRIEVSRKRTLDQKVYFADAEICGEYQVIRNYEFSAYAKSGEATRYSCWEILQHWILPDGKREVVARNHTLSHRIDSWNGDMEIRKNYRRYYLYSNADKYDVYPCKYHPTAEFKAEYKKYGIDGNLQGLTFIEAIELLPKYPITETLLKAKQYSLLARCAHDYIQVSYYWSSIKICLRNKYKVQDVSIWTDYLDLLRYFGKDIRNAHYVCPKNLNKEHDKLVKKKRAIEAKQETECQRKKALENEKTFQELKSMFFGIAFSSKEISVRMLESVQEVMEEGDVLHHCVFTNDYHTRPDSLILSAMVDGKKTETVEVSLKELKVVQCRGLQNKNSEYHDRIIALVNKNMGLIKSRLNPKKKKKQLCSMTA